MRLDLMEKIYDVLRRIQWYDLRYADEKRDSIVGKRLKELEELYEEIQDYQEKNFSDAGPPTKYIKSRLLNL